MTVDLYDGQGELIFDHALDAAAERIANVRECSCERCRDAEIEVRRELIEEGAASDPASPSNRKD